MNTRSSHYVVILAVQGEELVIERSLQLLCKAMAKLAKDKFWTIVVAENGRKDATKKNIERLPSSITAHLDYIAIEESGRGNAIQQVVAKYQATYYLSIDVDLPIDLEHLPDLFRPVEAGEADIVVGSRVGKRPFIRTLMTHGLRILNFCLLGVNVKDAQCNLKVFNARGAKVVSTCKQQGYFLDTELLARAKRDGLQVTEVPIPWIESRYPERISKVRVVRDTGRYMQSLKAITADLYPGYWKEVSKLAAALVLYVMVINFFRIVFGQTGFLLASYLDAYAPLLVINMFATPFCVLFLYWEVFLALKRLPIHVVMTVLVVGFGLLAIGAMLTLPVHSQDIYRDLVLALAQVRNGNNPYATTVNMVSQFSWSQYVIAWRDLPMTYGPLWTGFLFGVVKLTSSLGLAVFITKGASLGALIGIGILVWKIGMEMGYADSRKLMAVVLVIFNPIVIETVLIDVHNDVFMGLFITWGFYAVLRKNYALAASTLILGGAIKYVSLFLFPILLVRAYKDKNRQKSLKALLIGGALTTVLILALYVPYGGPAVVFKGLTSEVSDRGSVEFGLVGSWAFILWLGLSFTQVKILAASLGVMSAVFSVKHFSAGRYLMPLLLLISIGTPWFQPWYILWILPLLVFVVPVWMFILLNFSMMLLSPNLISCFVLSILLICLVGMGYLIIWITNVLKTRWLPASLERSITADAQ